MEWLLGSDYYYKIHALDCIEKAESCMAIAEVVSK